MNWRKFNDANIYQYNESLAIRFRELNSRKNWIYSDEFLIVPEPNWAAENNSESDAEYIGHAGEYELRLINTFGGLFLYINDDSASDFDVECKIGSSTQYAYYNDEFIHAIQQPLLHIDILYNSQDHLKKYFKLHKKIDPTSQKKKIHLIKIIINNVLKKYDKENDFAKFYDAWIKFEVILNIVEIRDHFIHNFETFILGLYFLDPLYTSSILNGRSDESIFKWTFTSIMHDIGYAVEKSKNVLNKISDLYSDIGMNTISSRINTFNLDKLILDELYNVTLAKTNGFPGECISINIKLLLISHLEEIFPNKNISQELFNQLEKKFNHGLVSAVLLIRQLLESRGISYMDTDSFNELLDSATGILFHHYYPSQKINLSPQRHLMIILLLIIDELQEWSRPLESYGASLKNKRLEFELYKISHNNSLNGNVNFDITIKLKIKQTDRIVDIVKTTLLDKYNKFSNYNYVLGNSQIVININVIDSQNNDVADIIIAFKDESQTNLEL